MLVTGFVSKVEQSTDKGANGKEYKNTDIQVEQGFLARLNFGLPEPKVNQKVELDCSHEWVENPKTKRKFVAYRVQGWRAV